MELEYILQNAALSIEALKDYYFSQIDKISKEVDKKMTRYIPGTMIDRYLFAKATGQEEILQDEVGIKARELAEKLLSDIKVNESEAVYAVSYKLDEDFANSTKYEINPTKADREFRKL